jgi:hypothetical protein
LEHCLVSELNDKEIYYISKYNTFINGYNQNQGGTTKNSSILSEEDIEQITKLLKTTNLTHKEIGIQFNVSENTICGINTGYYWKRDKIDYPIRKKVEKIKQQKISRLPDKDELYNLLCEKQNFCAVGRHYNVSDNAVRKWCIKLGLPSHTKDYKTEAIKMKSEDKKERKIKMIDLQNGSVLKIFSTITEAERFLNIPVKSSHIGQVCRGERKSAQGYKWEFLE